MRSTVVIAQPYLPKYRAPFFEHLSERLSRSGHALEVVVSKTASANADVHGDFPVIAVGGFTRAITGDRVQFRSALLNRVRARDVALVVTEQASKNVDFLPLLLMRRNGYRVAVWGHGGTYVGQRNRLAARIRLRMARSADAVFVYTSGGADYLQEQGVPRSRITVLNNTLDVNSLQRDLHAVTAHDQETLRSHLALTPGRTALFIGRMDRNKGIEFLLDSVPYASRTLPGFVLLLAGVGDRTAQVERAQSVGLPIRHLGRLDGIERATALRVAEVLVIPSWVGLVAVEALEAGLPIVTRDNQSHAPESEYLNRKTQSLWLPPNISPQEFGEAIGNLMAGTDLARMQEACRRGAGEHPLDEMVEAFHDGLMRCMSD